MPKKKKISTCKPDNRAYGRFVLERSIIQNCDLLLAFWDGRTGSIKNSIDLANKFKIPVKAIKI
jgi:hypothetical protein